MRTVKEALWGRNDVGRCMTEEVDESQPQEKWNRTPEEQDRIQAMSDRQLDASNTLAELSELKGDFSYWSANASTHASLFDLVLIGAELSAHSPSDLLREQSAKLRTLLPFTEEELGGMAVRMKAREKSLNSGELRRLVSRCHLGGRLAA